MSHLQGEDGGDRFVVTGRVLHVTAVAVLCDFGATGQPWSGATLACAQSCVGRCSGPQAPQDPVGPSRFTLFPTARGTEKNMRRRRKSGQKDFFRLLPEQVKKTKEKGQNCGSAALWDISFLKPTALLTWCRTYLFQHQTCRWEEISVVLLGNPLTLSHCLWPCWAVKIRIFIWSVTVWELF